MSKVAKDNNSLDSLVLRMPSRGKIAVHYIISDKDK